MKLPRRTSGKRRGPQGGPRVLILDSHHGQEREAEPPACAVVVLRAGLPVEASLNILTLTDQRFPGKPNV